MQPLVVAPRDHLTEAQVVGMLRDAPGLEFAGGVELLDMNLNVEADLTDLLIDGSVTRQSYADLHGTARLQLEGDLDWGTALLRPYMTVSDHTLTARFNLGAYFTSTPRTTLGLNPKLFEVDGYDILDVLASPTGEAYAVPKGANYLAEVERILVDQGVVRYLIDKARSDATLPSPKVWPMDETTTWLTVVNDLLAAVGYAGCWSDWDGRLRCTPYSSPSGRRPEWTYDVDPEIAMIAQERQLELDLYRAPNRWVFYRSNNLDGPALAEGSGIWTFVNHTTGPTSVAARGGRVLTKPVPLDVADQRALMDAGRKVIDADLRLPAKLTVPTSPNPLHWHFDRVLMVDPTAGDLADMLVASWTLPLSGEDMTQEWSQVIPTLAHTMEAALS